MNRTLYRRSLVPCQMYMSNRSRQLPAAGTIGLDHRNGKAGYRLSAPAPGGSQRQGLNTIRESHNYAKINLEDHEPAPIYASLEDAVARQNPTRYLPLGDGLRYITYIQRQDVEGKAYVMLPSGEWMRASPASVLSTFQGLIFRSNPRSSFGWIIKQATPVASPSFSAPPSGRRTAARNTRTDLPGR
jgi:hypothetical protein